MGKLINKSPNGIHGSYASLEIVVVSQVQYFIDQILWNLRLR